MLSLLYSLVPGIFRNCKIALFPFLQLLPLFSPPPVLCRAACRPGATSSFAAASRGIHASHWTSSHRPLPRAVPLQPVPRAPVSSTGCHRNAAVEGSLQCLGLPSCTRLSTPGDPASQSTRPLARSLPQTRRTSPPPRVNCDKLTPTAEPPFQSSSTPTAPTNSFASS